MRKSFGGEWELNLCKKFSKFQHLSEYVKDFLSYLLVSNESQLKIITDKPENLSEMIGLFREVFGKIFNNNSTKFYYDNLIKVHDYSSNSIHDDNFNIINKNTECNFDFFYSCFNVGFILIGSEAKIGFFGILFSLFFFVCLFVCLFFFEII
jgi:hypothetical protein